MAAKNPHARPQPIDDELDDILNGIVEGRDVPGTNDDNAQPHANYKASGTGGDGLGIDEEIVVTKKRIPIPKLDENRLCSEAGIPRLQRISKERLRFKGKGHEYGDVARMLNMYQLWLDDLYPRAKFADALAIIEKVGHAKNMQMRRKDWINEGKPGRTAEPDEEAADIELDERPPPTRNTEDTDGIDQATGAPVGRPDDTERSPERDADPDDDELDALLAEGAQFGSATPKTFPVRTAGGDEDPFADEMEAMADMEDMW
ncbi:chromosome segregation in meiosis protein 3 [Phaeosphaeria sp. MPI-PUGE-AT-0046c]|nr:chromosome segregation in meiosis protein 3 [Phaeosphaeria sp. MPI-PUGE-AT-0046c]